MSAPVLTVTLNPAVDISSEAETVRPIRKIRTRGDRQDPGGGGINVARVITILGGEAEALYLGGGAAGRLLAELLAEHGVQFAAIPIAGRTRISYTVHERSSGFEYRFVPEGPQVSDAEIGACLDRVRAFRGAYVVASGSLPPGAPDTLYADMAEIAVANGARFVLDCSGPGLARALDAGNVYLAKPSIGELEGIAGEKLDESGARRVAADLVARGCGELLAVTLGSEGALLASAGGILRVPARHVATKSAVGAGDSFLGAMVWALNEGRPAAEAFEFGVAAGAATAMTPGTELCRRDDVLRLFAERPGT